MENAKGSVNLGESKFDTEPPLPVPRLLHPSPSPWVVFILSHVRLSAAIYRATPLTVAAAVVAVQ